MIPPQYPDASGYFSKFTTPGRPGPFTISRDDVEVEFQASRRVKLGMHGDGSVHFSAAGDEAIRSGKSADGTFKGQGLISEPFATANPDVPYFHFMTWGPDFLEASAEPQRQRNSIVFVEKNLWHPDVPQPDCVGLYVSGFVLPGSLRDQVVQGTRGPYLPRSLRAFDLCPGLLVNLAVIDFGAPTIIGLFAFLRDYRPNSEYGCVFGISGGPKSNFPNNEPVETLHAVLPLVDFAARGSHPPQDTLDY